MKRKVYIESSVVSYYTGRPSRDVVIAGRQQSTQDFWPLLSQEFVPTCIRTGCQGIRQG